MGQKNAVVTGSNGDIGRSICEAMRAAGWTVIGIDKAEQSKDGRQYQRCDLTDLAELAAALDEVEARYGLVTTLVNNAGVWHGKPFFDITPADFDQTLAVNLRAMFFTSQSVARRLIAAGRPGTIVNVSSVAGRLGSSVPDYGASKAGIHGLTKGLAKVLGPKGIRVNAVAPGSIESAMARKAPAAALEAFLKSTPLGRIGEPREIANVVTFLAGDQSSYLTGAIVDANGGMY